MSKKNEPQTYTVKLIVIGDSGVGKTNILLRYCDSDFKSNYVATIGVDFKVKPIAVDGRKLKLQIWDTAGQERFKTINQAYYKGAAGIVLVYSVTDPNSFENIQNWVKQIHQYSNEDVHKILVANKIDMDDQRRISKEAGRRCAQRYNMEYFEVSAKEGTNISTAFLEVSRQIKLALDEQDKTGKNKVALLKLDSQTRGRACGDC